MSPVANDPARKWMWTVLAALVALQLYFVRELLAALLLFTLGFTLVGAVVVAVVLVEHGRRA